MTQRDRAIHFRELHARRPLVLPNAWNAASARIMEQAGASAIATTSAGISWAYGRSDGQHLQRDEMIQMIRYVVQAVDLPVTADVEGGYGTGSVQDVAETVRAVIDVGAAGINLEDSPGHDGARLLAPEEQAERIRAAREATTAAGGDLVINARIDVYLAQASAPETRFDHAVRRAKEYLAAGADCVFIPSVIETETITALVRAIDDPVNIMAAPGAPTIQQLGQLGVARVSLGPNFAQAALWTTQQAARELLDQGTYRSLENSLSFDDANSMFVRT